jgi:cysteine synthase
MAVRYEILDLTAISAPSVGDPPVSCSSIQRVAVEPEASKQLSGGSPGGHRIEGIGPGFVTSITRMDLIDEIVAVTDDDAMNTARELAVTEGIFGGTSSGANVFAALRIAADLGPGHRVVTVVVDSGLKYLDGDLFS